MKKSECPVRENGSTNTADERSDCQISSHSPLPTAKSPPINSYRDLEVWQFSMQLAKEIYSITREFPKEELYGLTSQIRRASVSVPANIAEGYGRDNAGDYVRFSQIAQGSLKEVETLLLLSCEVGIATQSDIEAMMNLADKIGRMLRSLIRSIQSRK